MSTIVNIIRLYLDLHPTMKVQGTDAFAGFEKHFEPHSVAGGIGKKGETKVYDLLASDDTLVMLNALHGLGALTQESGTQNYVVTGAADISTCACRSFMGNAGTTIRPFSGRIGGAWW